MKIGEISRISFALLIFSTVFASGCQSSRGAYVGPGDTPSAVRTADVRGQSAPPPPSGTATTVPLFASRAVKEEARNRQMIERYTGRPVMARPVTSDDLMAWRQAGVPDEPVIQHIRIHGATRPPAPQEVLTMQQRGVSSDVIRTMQEHPHPKVNAPVPPDSAAADGRQQYVAPPVGSTSRVPGSTPPRVNITPGQQPPIYPSYGQDMTGGMPVMDGGCGITDGGTYMQTPHGLVPICAPVCGCGCCCD